MTLPLTDEDALRARLAAHVAAALTVRTEALPHDAVERLRFARMQALARARATTRLQTASPVVAVHAGVASHGRPRGWQRAAAVLPLLVLIAGLALIHERTGREQLVAAADIDTVLLSDDLPPAAYTDPGFVEFLKAPQP